MAYNENMVNRVREALNVECEEKRMFGGICFLVNGKMLMGVTNVDLMVRFNPDLQEEALSKPHAREMDFTGRSMQGYAFVTEEGIKTNKQLQYWIDIALEYNKIAKASKKKKTKAK
jgi:TfoX/Sxy family transcriptional regulator of competence genes